MKRAFTMFERVWQADELKFVGEIGEITGGDGGGGATSRKSVDLATLPGWANLTDGNHTIQIMAKADGYIDSQQSTPVQVYKQPTGFTVSYVTEHGTTPGEKTQILTLSATELPEISETGYTFGGWYYDSSFSVKASVGDTLTENVTLYAKWDVVQYTITVSGSHVTYTGPSKISYGGEATLVFTPTTGYTLPSAVSVQGASHYWNDLTGELNLSYPTGDVSIVISADLITYSVTRNLDSCSASNLADIVAYGANYSNTLTPSTGKILGSGTVTVVMNDETVQPTYNADGSATISIDYVTGDISIVAHATAKTYSHTLSLVGCTASFTGSTIAWGDLYVNTLSAEAGRALIEGTVQVTMGGVALTPTYNQDGTVSISTTVTGAIVVTAEAVIKRTVLVSAQDCTYTNTSSDLFDGERYVNVFTPDSGFIFSTGTVSCTMGGVAVAPQYNADGTVTIDVEVNGDIVISATPTSAVNGGFIKIGGYDAILYLGSEAVDRVYKGQVLIYGNTP